MKTIFTIFFILFTLSFLNAQTNAPKEKNSFDKIKSYFDPKVPQKQNFKEKDKESGVSAYQASMKEYASKKSHFPQFQNTGNIQKDEYSYKISVEKWFEENPYFPQYIDTGNKQEDEERFEKEKREWAQHFPEKYKELFNEVFNDPELKEKYLDVIKIKE